MADLIRVLVVDDHPVVRRGIKSLLADEADIQVVGEAVDGEQAVDQFEQLSPDVVLMDLVMPNMNGIEAIQRITAECGTGSTGLLSHSGNGRKTLRTQAFGFSQR